MLRTLVLAVFLGSPRRHGAAATAAVACSAEFQGCFDTGCCSNPGFGCYKRPGKQYAQCRRTVPDCQDTDSWLCPETWAQCTESYGDCRASHCCRDKGSKCMRRSHLYYAQCRPEPKAGSGCSDWQSMSPDSLWLCPGWERCSAQHEECTLSRCCADKVRAFPHEMCTQLQTHHDCLRAIRGLTIAR